MKIILIFLSLFFLGCATTGIFSKTGMALISVQTESGGMAYNKGKIEKKGQACSYNVLGFIVFGDSGILEAKRDGVLEKVLLYDTEYTNVLGLFGSVCTNAYGL